MELTETLKGIFKETAKALKGSDRRLFMARIVKLLDTVETVAGFARNMTYNGVHPVVEIVETVYHTGVKLTQKAMATLEERFERLPGLEKWFVLIRPLPT